MVDSYPILTLIPPLAAIVLAIATRKVLLSLGFGIVTGALLASNFNIVETAKEIWHAFFGIFWAEGELQTGNIFILLFLLLLGVITALVLMAGGSEAFSEWVGTKIKSRRGAQGASAGLGVLLFIDDYFNALAVGQVAKPVTDKFQVSRAKLAYIIDSTSAPVAVLAPFSSWGASIIGIMVPIFAAANLEVSDLIGFVQASFANYYAIAAVVAVFVVIIFGADFGPMRTEEKRALKHGDTYADDAEIPGELSEDLPVHRPGAKRALIVPFIVLVVGVVGAMFFTGWRESGSTDPMEMLANTMVNDALIIGAILGTASALYYYFKNTASNDKFSASTVLTGSAEGAKSMLPAIFILIFAWALGTVVSDLGTGDYLGGLVADSSLPNEWLIPVMFIAAAGMAFSTGTSWGSFGLLLPIAGDIIIATGDTHLLIPALGAVLAGAVWGDHSSPISDTTILSSTGAGCDVITHVKTQLPYAGVAAIAALLGYCVLAITGSTWVGLIVTLVILVAAYGAIIWQTDHLASKYEVEAETEEATDSVEK